MFTTIEAPAKIGTLRDGRPCGTWSTPRPGANLVPTPHQEFCNNPNKCAACYRRRKEEARQRLNNNPLYINIVDNLASVSRRMRETERAKCYWGIPLVDATLVIHDETDIGEQYERYDGEITDELLQAIVLTPEGRNWSGDWGKLETQERGEHIVVEYRDIVTPYEKELHRAQIKAGQRLVEKHDIFTVDNAQNLFDDFQDMTQEELYNAGFLNHYEGAVIYRKVYVNEIDTHFTALKKWIARGRHFSAKQDSNTIHSNNNSRKMTQDGFASPSLSAEMVRERDRIPLCT